MNDKLKAAIMSEAVNGIITSRRLTELGIRRSALNELLVTGDLLKVERGIYTLKDAWGDEFYILQQRYRKGIYSHGTALYLHGYSERVPLSFHMTFPTGYNSKTVLDSNIIPSRIKDDFYYTGITEVATPSGFVVKCYDLERSICDCLRGSSNDTQTTLYAIKKYAASKEKNLNQLIRYAKLLRVESKINNYLEVLL
ncbi:MAG: abortive phage infection protein [Clostridia bacterium]|nr:abortive phage infection protein [Clostridia bacterium]